MSLFQKLFNRKRLASNTDKLLEEEADLEPEEDKESFFAELDQETDAREQYHEEQEDEEVYEVVEREIHPAKIICPDCGGITLEGLELCDKCGGELL